MPATVKKGVVKKPAGSKLVTSKKNAITKIAVKPKKIAATKATNAIKSVVLETKPSKKAVKPTEKSSKSTTATIKKPRASAVIQKTKLTAKPSAKKEKVTKSERSKVIKSMKPTNKTSSKATAAVDNITESPEATTKPRATDFSNLSFLGITPYKEKPGEEYMGDVQLKHFQSILMAWKVALMEEVDRTLHHMQDEAANYPDPNDRASQEEEFSLELRARDRERKLTRKIDEALKRITDKEYGFCDACGIEIGIRRLEARPTATLCIDCKTLDEIREKHMVS
ncbi:hypothetical protein BH10PSE19_BH10PSE19_07690 [soil metagenome]